LRERSEADVSGRGRVTIRGTIFSENFLIPNLPLQSVALFPYLYSIVLLLLSHFLFDLSAPRFALCPHLHLSFAFLPVHFLGGLAHLGRH
jgi:hypothetical protein